MGPLNLAAVVFRVRNGAAEASSVLQLQHNVVDKVCTRHLTDK